MYYGNKVKMRYVRKRAERIRRDFVQPAQEKYREKISFVFEVLQKNRARIK